MLGVNVPAAWGAEPGLWPLPAATSPRERWHRAVALGGQGRYSAALAELDALEVDRTPSVAQKSLMASTRGSWTRQMGWHAVAARHDGAAIAMAGLVDDTDSAEMCEARCDALTGLAADRLGVGRFGASDALLSRCEIVLRRQPVAEQLWRQQLRLHWVRAELAMYSGDGRSALRHALVARERAADTDSLRHRAKTDLIVAAAYSAIGDSTRARKLAHNVLDICSEHGLVPLQWAAAMLSNGLGEVETAPAIVAECAEVLRSRGAILAGVASDEPDGSILAVQGRYSY